MENDGNGACVESFDALHADLRSLLRAMGESRRRFVVRCLLDNPAPVTLRDVAIRLAAWEEDVSVADVPWEKIEPLCIGLYHHHVPKLAEADIIEYDRDRGRIALARESNEATAAITLARMVREDGD